LLAARSRRFEQLAAALGELDRLARRQVGPREDAKLKTSVSAGRPLVVQAGAVNMATGLPRVTRTASWLAS